MDFSFLIGAIFGCILGWLICMKSYFPKRKITGSENCKTLRQKILLSFDEIAKPNIYDFQSEIKAILKLYGSVIATGDTSFVLTKSTACLGEIHNALIQGIMTQPVELVSHSIEMTYVSLSAEAGITGEVTVAINATPGSTVTLQNRSEVIKVDETGRARVKIKISRDELLQGFLKAKAVKGGLEKDIKITIT